LAAISATTTNNISTSDATDFSAGKLMQTGNPADLAIVDGGFFAARNPAGQLLYLRGGQFHRDVDGRLVTVDGLSLQADGRDLGLKDGAFAIAADAVVTQGGEPVGRLDIVDFTDRQALTRVAGGGFAALDGQGQPVDHPIVKQGVVEASNVATAGEMVSMMAALRRAETGQKLMNTYDDLMGRVLTTFGQQ
jgi:flagellar basal body rod protein FlgG